MSELSELNWAAKLQHAGLKPFIATSETLLDQFDLCPMGIALTPILFEDDRNAEFLRAYPVSEWLAYNGLPKSEGYVAGSDCDGMPNWVFVNCVLLHTAAIGLMISVDAIPAHFRTFYEKNGKIALSKLSWLPLSGEISAVREDGRTLIAFSTFNLYRRFFGVPGGGHEYRSIALLSRRAHTFDWFYAVTQYDNPAIRMHGRFGSHPIMIKPMLPAHSQRSLSYLYKMKIDFDPRHLDLPAPQEADRLLHANDTAAKQQIASEINQGWCHTIVPPFWVSGDNDNPPYLALSVFPPKDK